MFSSFFVPKNKKLFLKIVPKQGLSYCLKKIGKVGFDSLILKCMTKKINFLNQYYFHLFKKKIEIYALFY